MTTAHKPQDRAMRGGGSAIMTQGGYFTGGAPTLATSAKDQRAHTKLKFRQLGQSSHEDIVARDMKAELEEKERQHFEQVRRDWERKRGLAAAVALSNGSSSSSSAHGPIALLEDRPGGSTAGGRPAEGVDEALTAFDDADDDALDKFAAAADNDSDEDDDEDDTAELMRELERIKREREEERARKERELAELSQKETTEAILKGNPLLTKGTASALGSSGSSAYGSLVGGASASGGGGAVKRRFGDDTVFSHTHAGEPEAKKRFLNDSLRSDFHRSFMKRFFA